MHDVPGAPRQAAAPFQCLLFISHDPHPRVDDLPADIDLYCDEPAEFYAKLARGDDFAHWTLRYPALREQVRGALSLTARWWLLAHDVFPLARDELPVQLVQTRQIALARALGGSIHDRPDVAALTASLTTARALTG